IQKIPLWNLKNATRCVTVSLKKIAMTYPLLLQTRMRMRMTAQRQNQNQNQRQNQRKLVMSAKRISTNVHVNCGNYSKFGIGVGLPAPFLKKNGVMKMSVLETKKQRLQRLQELGEENYGQELIQLNPEDFHFLL